MSKKSLDNKVARKFIVEARENGKTDQEIYNELSQQYYDKKHIALLITGTVTKENKNKYKIYNNILLSLLGLVILTRIYYVFTLPIRTGESLAQLTILVFAMWLAFEIKRYNGQIYRAAGLMGMLALVLTSKISADMTRILIDILFTVVIAGLSLYLERKMFPNYGNKKLVKDSNGEYILNDCER